MSKKTWTAEQRQQMRAHLEAQAREEGSSSDFLLLSPEEQEEAIDEQLEFDAEVGLTGFAG